MTEALDKLEQLENDRKDEKEAAAKHLQEVKKFKKDLKKRKWVEYRSDDTLDEEAARKRANFDPATRIKRKKAAVLLGYSGVNYFGMQRNPGMATIEEELFKAMIKNNWITPEGFEQPQTICFQRAARTDKGVSAARQVCSIKLRIIFEIAEELNVEALNSDLPEQIRVFAVQRATKGFNSKDQCNARTYTYTLPSIAFDKSENSQHTQETYRIDKDTLAEVSRVLKMYEGTQNFHNFTSRKNFHDPSAKRFIMSFKCSDPFVSPQGIEFLTLKVKGQSFMLHQIRKMVGLVIAIVRGNTTIETMERAFSEDRLDLPMAPGLGLVLDTVHYDRYNERYGHDGMHKPLTWTDQENQIQMFIEKYILANIYKTEVGEKSMVNWLETLPKHSYETRQDKMEAGKQEATKNNEDDED